MNYFYKRLFWLSLLLLATTVLRAQSPTCATATAICDNVTSYPANTSTNSAPVGNNYDCLLSTPDPAWFYFTIAQSGSISMALQNSNVVDVDFILWGPFPNVAAALGQCGNLGQGGAGGSVIDCSFDAQAFEQVDIANAVAGQVYVMMITNYSGANTNIFTQPNTGTGDLACPCGIRSRHFLTPLAGNDGTLIATQDSAAQYGLCAGDTMYFSIGMRAQTLIDSLGFNATLTNINNSFNPSQFGIFGPFYPVAGRFDTMEMTVAIYPGSNFSGIVNFSLGITSTNRSTRVICPEVAPVSIIIPGVNALDTLACSGQTLQLGASSGVPATVFGSPSFSWTQIGGPPTTLTGANTATPTVVVPIGNTSATTPSLFQVQYNYGSCTIRDTVRLNYPNARLNLAPNPASVCAGSAIVLTANITDTLAFTNACLPSYTLASIPFSPVAGTGTNVSLGDDAMSSALPIGFTFRFFCNNYTNFYIGSNGFITFSPAQPANQYSQNIPAAATPNNLIALAWSDLDPSSGSGNVRYFTTGTAPNRRLVVNFNNVDYYYLLFPGGNITVQAVLYETTNVIELHITNVDNELNVTQGIENAAGSSALAIAGRNRQAFSASNQSFRFTPNPGPVVVTPPTYTWSPTAGLNNATIFNPAATPAASTTYNITVTDGVCRYTGAIPVTVGALNVSTTVVNATCAAPTSGVVNTTPSGGTGPFTYQWSNGRTTQNNTGLSAGAYTVTVTAANGCTGTASASITSPVAPTLSNTVTNVLCNGDTTGAINLTVSAGLAPYTFSWSNGRTTEDLSNISAGNYRVTVTAANGCTVVSPNILISQSNGLTLSIASITNISCNGLNNGAINTNIAGGSLPYTFTWSNGANTQNLTGLGAGNYNLSVRDANGCSVTSSTVIITQPAALTVTPFVNNVICNGATSGSINSNPSGGTMPYTFSWSNGRTSQNINLLAAGNYTLTVRDANSCSVTASISVSQPAPVTATVVSITNASCSGVNNGAININPSGGNSPYTFSWSNAATSQNITGLAAGTYSVTVRDAAACVGVLANISITQSPPIVITQDSVRNVTCSAGTNGAIFIGATGGTAPLVYNWSNGRTTQDITGLNSGIYSVTVSDINNCTATRANILISEPVAITITSTSITQASCGASNGAINIAVAGGNPIFTFVWSNGVSSQNLTGLASGNYAVTATDARGCIATNTFAINNNSSLSVTTTSIANVNCNGAANGGINVSVAGGVSPYSFSWSNGTTNQNATGLSAGLYNLTVTDATACIFNLVNLSVSQPSALSVSSSSINILCNGNSTGAATVSVTGGVGGFTYVWSNGLSTASITGLTAGNYIATATDANGCVITNNITISQPSAISVALAATNLNCNSNNTGSINSTVTGATAPYRFSWSNGATGQNLSNLAAGVYRLTVTDANNCVSSNNVVTISQPSALSLTVASTADANCSDSNDGFINVNIGGGAAPYRFVWSNAATGQNLANLAAGLYAVTVTDANGCTISLNNINILAPAALVVAVEAIIGTLPCDLSPVGELEVTATGGGAANVNYVWSNGSTNAILNNLAAGNYVVTATNANGCTATANAGIIAPLVPTINPFIGQIATVDTTITWGSTVALNAGSNVAGVSYNWTELLNPANAFIQNPNQAVTSATPNLAAQYQFVVTASATTGIQTCTVRDTLRLTVTQEDFLGLPNAFTPNGDGNNDRFRPVNLEPQFIKSFKVFNRWGQVLYDNSTLSDGGWDGVYKNEAQPRDVYIYLLMYQFPQNPEPIEMRGEVTLIR